MDYSIFSHSHLHLVRCKTNGQRWIVLINLQKAFDIINHKTLLKKNVFCWIFSSSITWSLDLSRTSVYQFSSEYQKYIPQCCKYKLRSSTTIEKAFLAGGVPPLAKNLLIPHLEKFPSVDSPLITKFLLSATNKG